MGTRVQRFIIPFAFFLVPFVSSLTADAQTAKPLRIGVTLHPYYSWTKNVVGDLPGYEVRPILPGEIDAGDYQPRPEDIKKLMDLDAVVVNGIGHRSQPRAKHDSDMRSQISQFAAEEVRGL